MNRKWLGLIAACAVALQTLSCSSGQQLLSINIAPAQIVFGAVDTALFAQLTATGVYAHPPATKDITAQVTWSSAVPQVALVTSTGRVTPNTNCGVSPITATLQTNNPTGNIVVGTMSVTVDGPALSNCPTATPTP